MQECGFEEKRKKKAVLQYGEDGSRLSAKIRPVTERSLNRILGEGIFIYFEYSQSDTKTTFLYFTNAASATSKLRLANRAFLHASEQSVIYSRFGGTLYQPFLSP